MRLLIHDFSCFLAITTRATILFSSLILAQNADGPSVNSGGFADDVNGTDVAWNNEYPPYEGTSPPELNDYPLDSKSEGSGGNGALDTPDILDRRAAKDFFLRIMPLGASITQGTQSSDNNGYRKWLRSQLRYKGWKVNMVGRKQEGTMADKDNEGHPGWVIDEIHHNAWQPTVWMKPNLVLINAGTNDCIQENRDPNNAGVRMKLMIDDIFSSVPGVTVILSTLVPSRDHNACSKTISQQYRDLLKNTYKDARIGLADIETALSLSDLVGDGIHPNDNGYKIFAGVWWNAISKLEDKIQPPGTSNGIDDTSVSSPKTCTKVAGNARGPVQSQKGAGHDDGKYVHNRIERGAILSARIEKRADPPSVTDNIPWHMFFANVVVNNPNFLRSEIRDDWIRIYHGTDGKNIYYYRQNNGDGTFGPSTTFDVDMDCNSGPLYAFADFNNDGLDDFYCLKPGSAIHVSINQGGNPPTFKSLGQVVPTHAGFDAPDVRIADIDGDGRADYCLTKSDGEVVCSRNGGVGTSYFWQGFSTAGGLRGTVFDKKKADKKGVVLADMNGDFRSDYMYIGDNGNVETWINQRGWGTGIVPDWTSSGITHPGQGETGIRDQIKFGRIYGSGRLDYIYLKEESTYYDVKVWQNTGGGGTKRKADGNFYCDMRGTGADDYVWIYYDGHAAEMFANIHQPPEWGHSTSISLNIPGPRVGIHLADWNGNGRCDVLVQNKATGALTLWENRFDAAKNSLTFVNVGVVTGAATCTQGWGLSPFDRGMRLADIDGDGRADVLCIAPDGFTTAWLNPKAGLLNVGQIKRSEGWDRANIRFADVEGSGRADMIHVDKYTGASTVLKNNGHKDGGGGSSFSWTNRGVLYSPIDRGETMTFANLGGLGRADLVHILPLSNRAYIYFNECGGGSGGDDGLIQDPGLPNTGSPGSPSDDGDIDKCTKTWNKLEDIPKDASMICKILSILQYFWNKFNNSLEKYDQLVSSGYDGKFGTYAKSMVDQTPALISAKALEHGNDFFACEVMEKIVCCYGSPTDGGCNNAHPGECRWCQDSGDVCKTVGTFPGEDGNFAYEKRAQPCPPDYSQRGIGDEQSVYFSHDNTGLQKFVAATGIESKYIAFGPSQFYKFDSSTPRPCLLDPKSCGVNTGFYWDFPYLTKQYSTADVDNPKDLLSASIENWKGSRSDLSDAITALKAKKQLGDGVDPTDLIFACIFPVLLIEASIQKMGEIIETADQIEKAQHIANILNWIGAIIFVLPVVGEGLGAVTAPLIAQIGRLLSLLGDAGTVAIGIYDSVTGTGNAQPAFAALAAVFAGRYIGRASKVEVAARAMRNAEAKVLETAGKDFVVVRDVVFELLKKA